MEKEEKHTISDNLLIRFLSNEADDNELLLVNDWLNENEEHKEYLAQLKKIWKHSDAISDFGSIDTKADLNSVINRVESNKEKPKIKTLNNYKLLFRIAATIIILFSLGILFKDIIIQEPYLIVSTDNNEQKELILADGSHIILNANSKLEYPEKFKRKSREVKLTGEAFFEITKNPDKAFKILVNNSIVEVLGTSFNINSSSHQVIVDVLTGKVAFYDEKDKNKKVVLHKGERGIKRNNEIEKSLNHNQNFLAWSTGILEFKNTEIQNVISELEEYYGIKFLIQDTSLNNFRITTTLDNQTLENVLEEFEIIFALDYNLLNDTVKYGNKH